VADRKRVVVAGMAVAALAVGAYVVWGPSDGSDASGEDGGAAAAGALDLPRGTIVAVDFEYPVGEVTVGTGDPLTFENRGPSRHTLTADNGRFDSGVIEAGQTFTVTLDGPRQIEVHCEIHPTMRAVITVTAP
jgi:plastocyanin